MRRRRNRQMLKIPVYKSDGGFLYEKTMDVISGSAREQKVQELFYYVFSEYELKGYHYTIESNEQDIEEEPKGILLMESIASRLYKRIIPFLDVEGNLNLGFTRKDKISNNGSTNNNSSGNNNDNNMNENSPLNTDITQINTPTYKSKNIGSFSNTFEGSYNNSSEREYVSPEYIKEFESIKTYITDAIREEVEKYIYEIRLIY